MRYYFIIYTKSTPTYVLIIFIFLYRKIWTKKKKKGLFCQTHTVVLTVFLLVMVFQCMVDYTLPLHNNHQINIIGHLKYCMSLGHLYREFLELLYNLIS